VTETVLLLSGEPERPDVAEKGEANKKQTRNGKKEKEGGGMRGQKQVTYVSRGGGTDATQCGDYKKV